LKLLALADAFFASGEKTARNPITSLASGSLRASLAVALVMFAASPLLATPAHAEEPAEATGTVTRVTVQGNKRIEEATILERVTIRRGDALVESKVRRDLKAVYNLGYFDDVRFESYPDGAGVGLVIIVTEKPAIRDVRLQGNKKIDEDDLNEVIDIRAFTVLNDADVKANADRIRDKYIEKGYYLVDVNPVITTVGDDQVELVFDITENQKVVVQRIEFTGNDHLAAGKIKRYLQTHEGGVLPWLTNRGTFKQDALDTDKYIVEQVYREEGYVDIKVSPPETYLSPDKKYIYVSFHVEEGEKYNVGKIDVSGDFVPEKGLTEGVVKEIIGGRTVFDVQDEQWRTAHDKKPPFRLFRNPQAGVGIEPGEAFKLSKVQAVMTALTDLYSDQGYAFVNVVPIPHTDPERRVADIEFIIEKGESVHVGNINITGNDPTFDKVVRRELPVNEGDLYRGSLIRAGRARLERLGYFEKVDISTPRGAAPNELDLNVNVAEQPTGSFSLGLGFSSLEQFVFTANVSKNNFLGLGYVMSAAVNVSALRKQYNLSFFDPYFLDSRWTFDVSGYSITKQFQEDEYQRGGSIGLGRYLDQRDDIQLRLQYTLEDVGLTSIDPYKAKLLGGELFRNGLTSSMGLTLEVDKRNNRIFATKGIYASASASLAGGFRLGDDKLVSMFGGKFNFAETKLNFRYFQPLIKGSDALVFRVNSTMGWIFSTDGQIVPYIQRYRAGGINSVRGYDWYSLGPKIRVLGNEDPIHADQEITVGGTQTWINNFELEAPIVKQAGILAVVFFDAGNSFGDPWGHGNINPLDLRMSYGAGIRWRSPIGPLRFEYGIPIQPLEGERKSVFDFSIGSFF
jgi:outer membrane protein insertion porin family